MIYLDNAATTYPKPESVIERMNISMRDLGANPGRATHRMAVDAENQITETRSLAAEFFNFSDPMRVVFTHNCTDALNHAIKGSLAKGDHVVTTQAAHNSVSRPLEALVDQGRISLTRVPVDESGMVDPGDIIAAIKPHTRLVEVTHGSNVTGTVAPIEEIGKALQEKHELLYLVDAAQSAGVLDIDMKSMGIDLLALPGHKGLFGPPGTGLLLVGERADVQPWREGGTGGDSATRLQPTELPFYWESGTPNTVGIAGLQAGMEWVRQVGVNAIYEHERELMAMLIDAFIDDKRFKIFGPKNPDTQVGVFSFLIKDQDPHTTGAILDNSFSIAVRTGLHCAPYMHKAIGSFARGGTARISLSYMNTTEDIDHCIEAMRKIADEA